MNVCPINSNRINITNRNVGKYNTNTSFNGFNRTTLVNNAKTAVSRANTILYLIVSAPFVILANLFDNKDDTVNSIILDMQNVYLSDSGNIGFFNEQADEIKRILKKRAIKKDYANFSEEAITFLQANFKRSQNYYRRISRLKPFNDDSINFVQFMDTINKSTKVAITKNSKFDLSLLNQKIKSAREIIQKDSNRI